jgi:hypothetical protein
VVSKIWKKFKKTGGVENKNRSGRPRKTNAKQDHYIKLLSLRDRNLSSQAISKQLLDKEGKRILQARSIRSRLIPNFFAIISCLILFWQSATIIPFSKSVNSRVFFFFPIKDNFVCLQQHKKHSLNLSRLIIRELEKISTFAVLETRFPRLWEATKFVNMSNGFS